jgi:hypothetical protein
MPARRRHETCEERAERLRKAHNEAQRRYRARKLGRPIEQKVQEGTEAKSIEKLIKLMKKKYSNTTLKGKALYDAMVHDSLITKHKEKRFIAYGAMGKLAYSPDLANR